MRIGGTLLVAAALAMSGCGDEYVTNSRADVLLIVASINEGSVLDSEVRYGTSTDQQFICEDEVPVQLAVRNKNPNVETPRVPGAVLITGYEVRYFRSDGRSQEGIDVPYRIAGKISTSVDVGTSGTSDVIIEVVRRQAKLEPPLSNIEQATILTMFAHVTIYGETVSGDRVEASGDLQIDFADYLDSETSCPAA
jgi:hypothetical protein